MTIRIGTSERGGTFYSQGSALKTIFERQPELAPVELVESKSASTENAGRLEADEIEFGFMASNWIGRARNGEAPFGKPIDLAMAAPMNAGPLFFVVRAGFALIPGVASRRFGRFPTCARVASRSGRARAAWCSMPTAFLARSA